MQKTLAAAMLAATFGVTGGAFAADVYTPESMKDTPVYVPVTSWAGFYAGVNMGAAWSANRGTLEIDAEHYGDTASSSDHLSPYGAFGGGQIGHNWQRGNIVFGIEADVQGASVEDKANAGAVAGDRHPSFATGDGKSDLDYLGTLRGRLGYSFGRTLVYGTGGFAFGGVRDFLSITDIKTHHGYEVDTETVKQDDTATGYVVGGGLEYAMSPAWSFKAEYQYIDLGRSILAVSASAGDHDTSDGQLTFDHTYHTFRIGVNYHTGTPYEPLK